MLLTSASSSFSSLTKLTKFLRRQVRFLSLSRVPLICTNPTLTRNFASRHASERPTNLLQDTEEQADPLSFCHLGARHAEDCQEVREACKTALSLSPPSSSYHLIRVTRKFFWNQTSSRLSASSSTSASLLKRRRIASWSIFWISSTSTRLSSLCPPRIAPGLSLYC